MRFTLKSVAQKLINTQRTQARNVSAYVGEFTTRKVFGSTKPTYQKAPAAQSFAGRTSPGDQFARAREVAKPNRIPSQIGNVRYKNPAYEPYESGEHEIMALNAKEEALANAEKNPGIKATDPNEPQINPRDYLDDQNGPALGRPEAKELQSAAFTGKATASNGLTVTIAGNLVFKRGFSTIGARNSVDPHFEIDKLSFAQGFVAKLKERLPQRIFCINEQGKTIYTGQEKYRINIEDIRRCYASAQSNPIWYQELCGLVEEGKVDGDTLKQCIEHYEAHAAWYQR